MLIREAVEAGRVDEAVRRVNELDSEVSIVFHKPSTLAPSETLRHDSAWLLAKKRLLHTKTPMFPMIKDFMHHA